MSEAMTDFPEQKLIEALDSVDGLLAYADYRPDASSRHQLAIARSITLSIAAELAELREKYNELIYAVASKYPNETRHQTALRYINQAELPKLTAGQVEQKERTNG